MIKKMQLFIFIDAFGWQVLQEHPEFLKELELNQKPLKTILGYSSGCDPSIISGLTPSEHLHWSSFYYSPETCPYKWVKWLNCLPRLFTDHHRVRHQLSKFIKRIHGFTGYFQIYNVPFKYLPYFDYAEKKRLWETEGLLQGKSIFDFLQEQHCPYYVGDLDSEEQQLCKVEALMRDRSIGFAYLLFGKLDAVMHKHGTKHRDVAALLMLYDRRIKVILNTARETYEEVDLYLFSDHGMHNVNATYNLKAVIDKLNLKFGIDYVAFYDSTMARFWYLNDKSRKMILDCLSGEKNGSILSVEELQKLGVYFPDHRYGETIFLMRSSVLIVPSFMGLKPIHGMHGYHPDDPDSDAMIMSNRPLPDHLLSIKDIASLVMSQQFTSIDH